MEATKTITANSRLGVYVKQMDTQDKTLIFSVTNKYVRAKRTCGNAAAAYREVFNTLVQLGNKYNFVIFKPDSNVQAMIDEFATCVEIGTRAISGEITYTCTFGSVAQANLWLSYQHDIQIKNFQIQTSGAGNKVVKINIEYVVTNAPTNATYQIEDVQKTRFFFKSKQQDFNRKWQKRHPQHVFLSSIKKSWGFRAFGSSIGYFRLILERYVVLYATKNNNS